MCTRVMEGNGIALSGGTIEAENEGLRSFVDKELSLSS